MTLDYKNFIKLFLGATQNKTRNNDNKFTKSESLGNKLPTENFRLNS